MESESVTGLMAVLALHLGIIFFGVRFFGRLVKKAGIPQVLGELLAGVIIGPYALGGIHLPGFPHGIFPMVQGPMAVSNELYAFASIGSIILLFASGLETNIRLFLRYSLAGSLISIGGVLASFAAGDMAGMLMFRAPFTDPRCLFMGLLVTANSLGIVARLLSDQKKMDTPESITILAASVFDDVLTIIALAVVLGIVTVISGAAESAAGLDVFAILAVAGKAFGIWLSCIALGLIFAKKLAGFLKLFRSTFDFSVLALGFALVLAGLFEKQGLAMIIGAYVGGLSLSKTDIAPVIQERIRGIYEFFVPVFFAVMGMMVNFRDIIAPPVLAFGAIYAAAAVLAKLVGCGFPALLLGFNLKGALRIGLGMAPRGEFTLILAGIGLGLGILGRELFAVLILMILITTLTVPPLLSAALRMAGSGTRKPAKGNDSASMTWEFSSGEISDIVLNALLKDLRGDGFYVQVMNMGKGLSQARKDDISLSIRKEESVITIECSVTDLPFVKTAVYEVIVGLHDSIRKLKDSSDPRAMKKDLMNRNGRTSEELLSLITPECVSLDLKGETKEGIITELVDILAAQNKLLDRDAVLADVLERERAVSTGMEKGIALPHAKSDGIDDLKVAVGIKRDGIDFDSVDGKKSHLFILVVSPKKTSGPHIQFLASVGTVLKDDSVRQRAIDAATPAELTALLHLKPAR